MAMVRRYVETKSYNITDTGSTCTCVDHCVKALALHFERNSRPTQKIVKSFFTVVPQI